MNRLASYFENAKLAKQYYVQAEEYAKRKEIEKAVHALSMGMLYLVAAMNCVAAIGFRHKPR